VEKIVVIGSPGAGKTDFALQLGKICNIKVLHLDRLFWKRGWGKKSRDARIDILYQVMLEKQWIIEGTYLGSFEPRLEEADTIIFLDMLPLLCLWRIIIRHWKNRGKPRRDLPMDSKDKLTLGLMLKVLAFPFAERKRLKQTLNKYDSGRVIWLHSRKGVAKFLKEQKQDTQGSSLNGGRFQPNFNLAQT